MSSVTLKLTTLIIRTLSKPIANQIKAQAREHPSFRRICISFAQSVHRIDMRLRLGLLRDATTVDRPKAKDPAATAESLTKRLSHGGSGSSSESALTKPSSTSFSTSSSSGKPRIRPLTEAKAIDTGATFISEAFLFFVGGSLILFEAWRSRRKENTRREDVADRLAELAESERNARRGLVALEREVIRLRAEENKHHHLAKSIATVGPARILPQEIWELEEKEEEEDAKNKTGVWRRILNFVRLRPPDRLTGESQDAPREHALEKAPTGSKSSNDSQEVHRVGSGVSALNSTPQKPRQS
ncbi:MAG: hypothetical protein M1826_005825 [Phylliscum demangeonii]|nr:MAG: hypothetical protein M1826_005825 [Phylliscum demangeonii]